MHSGEVLTQRIVKNNSATFIQFLSMLDAYIDPNLTVHLVLAGPGRATRSRMSAVSLVEGGSTDVEDVVPGPVREDRPRLGVRRG